MLELLDYKWALVIVAGAISFCNLLYYLWTVLQGKTKPHMFTWLIWGLVTAVAAATQLVSNGGAGAFFTVLVACNCLIIAALAYFKGEKEITKSDKICLAICLIAIALWPFAKTPLLSLLMVTAIDLAGFLPTIRKSYNKPHEENLISFSLYAVTYSMSVLALAEYSVLTTLYPVVIALASFLMLAYLATRRYQLGYKVLR